LDTDSLGCFLLPLFFAFPTLSLSFSFFPLLQNLKHYGEAHPPKVSSEYGNIDIPIDVVAGRKDGVVPPENVHAQYVELRERGVEATYTEFDCGHLNFIHQPSEDFTSFLLSRLVLE